MYDLQGLPIVYPYLQQRILRLPREDFIVLLTSHTADTDALTGETKKKLSALGEQSDRMHSSQSLMGD